MDNISDKSIVTLRGFKKSPFFHDVKRRLYFNKNTLSRNLARNKLVLLRKHAMEYQLLVDKAEKAAELAELAGLGTGDNKIIADIPERPPFIMPPPPYLISKTIEPSVNRNVNKVIKKILRFRNKHEDFAFDVPKISLRNLFKIFAKRNYHKLSEGLKNAPYGFLNNDIKRIQRREES